jgi:hypothetical protein
MMDIPGDTVAVIRMISAFLKLRFAVSVEAGEQQTKLSAFSTAISVVLTVQSQSETA